MTPNYEISFTKPGVTDIVSCSMPTLGPGQLLVRTRTSLISPGTERAILLGLSNTSGIYPRTPGYSNIGEVVEVAPDLAGWKVGDIVATRTRHRLYQASNARSAHHLPAGLAEEEAAFYELSAIALQGVRKARVELGESVAVIGSGLVGLLAMQLAQLSGALPAIMVDRDARRLEFARHVGADHLVLADEQVKKKLEELGNGVLPDVVIEATGHPDAVLSAFDLARPHGRVVLLGSTRGETELVNFYRGVHKKGLTVLGAHVTTRPIQDSFPGWWSIYDDQQVTLRLLAQGRLLVRSLITHRFTWTEAADAYAQLARWDSDTLGMVLDWTT
ncbi:zinc-binding alcohol dehydrogenase [Chloroflexi bacterium TSY]|nr:zinc-binding alcohol dehydrogenase [Chloroflexi bacterium TSY]